MNRFSIGIYLLAASYVCCVRAKEPASIPTTLISKESTSHFENYTWFWFADGEKCGEFDLNDRFVPYAKKFYEEGNCTSHGYTQPDGSGRGDLPYSLGTIGKQVEVYFFLNVKGLEVEVKRTSHFENYTWFWFADGEKCGEFDLNDRFVPYAKRFYEEGNCTSHGYTQPDGSGRGDLPYSLGAIGKQVEVYFFLKGAKKN